MQSLKRKLANRSIAGNAADALKASSALARTGQVARTTLELGDGDVFLDEALSSAADTSATVGDHEGELEGSRELTDDVVDVLPDMTEDAWEAEDVGQIAADGADWAAEFAAELEVELEAAKVELEQSLEEAHQALTEAGLARSEAAQAVADAQAAVADAGTALTEAIAAAQAASDASVQAQLADGRLVLSDAAPVAADGQGKPVGALWMRKTAGAVTAMWEWTALGWVSRPLAEQIIPKILIGEGTYGDLDGVRLTAKTVGAEKLLVGDFQNYWNDPEFRNTAGYSPWDVVGRGLERNGTGTQSGGYFPHTEISVQPGERLKFTVSKSHVAGTTSSVSLYVQRRTADGASAGSNTAVLQLAGGDGEYTSEWVVPASVERLTFGFYTQAATTSSVRVRLSNVRVSKMTAGELIVDGAIQAQHVAAGAIVADKIAADAVTAEAIASESVTAEKIAAGAVATEKLYAGAVTADKIAAEAVNAEKITAGAITAEKIAAAAIDSMTIRGAQIFGGYMEAPVIASSSRLGTGANVLNDPGFSSTVNTAWVASGHLGDAAATQRDTITWDQTWTMPNVLGTKTQTYRNWGRVVADLSVSAAARKTGTTIFANFSWLTKTARTLNNPYTFVSHPKWVAGHGQSSGFTDPSFLRVSARAGIAGTARTTYLTNTAVAAVKAGERWNVRLGFERMSDYMLPYLSAASVEIINAATSTVLLSYAISNEELMAGSVNTWWDSTFTGNVKYRVKTVYTSGGGRASRVVTSDSYARGSTDGVAHTTPWLGSGERSRLGYTSYPAAPFADPNRSDVSDVEYNRRVNLQWELTSALFAQVQPAKGWRMTERDGLELFNQLGARTAKLDGEENYFAGKLATAESGRRLELFGSSLSAYNQFDVLVAKIEERNDGWVFNGAGVEFPGDTDWLPFTMSGWTTQMGAPPSVRVKNGVIYFRGVVSHATFDGGFTTVGTLPAAIPAPVGYATATITTNSTFETKMRVTADRLIQVWRNGSSGAWVSLNPMFYTP